MKRLPIRITLCIFLYSYIYFLRHAYLTLFILLQIHFKVFLALYRLCYCFIITECARQAPLIGTPLRSAPASRRRILPEPPLSRIRHSTAPNNCSPESVSCFSCFCLRPSVTLTHYTLFPVFCACVEGSFAQVNFPSFNKAASFPLSAIASYRIGRTQAPSVL